jgi:hypothetical protein
MRLISKWSFPTGAAVLTATLILGLFAVQPARADDYGDPSITTGYSITSLGLPVVPVGADSWFYAATTQSPGADTYVSFHNTTGTAWTSLEIIALYAPTAGHTFTAYVASTANLAPGANEAFSSATVTNTSSTATFNLSGANAVPNGDYLDFTFTNWYGGGDSALTGFEFGANGATPGTPTSPVPEPGTMLLLGVGMFGLAIFGKRRMNKEY